MGSSVHVHTHARTHACTHTGVLGMVTRMIPEEAVVTCWQLLFVL